MSQHIDAVAKQSGLDTLNNNTAYVSSNYVSNSNIITVIKGFIDAGSKGGTFLAITCTNTPDATKSYRIRYTTTPGSNSQILEAWESTDTSLYYVATANVNASYIGAWQQFATTSKITSFAAIGLTSGTTTNVEIQLPSNALFTSSNPLFMIASFRGSTSNANEGYAILKIDQGVIYVTNKSGIQTLEDLSYNSTTKKLTFTSGTYITFIVFGLAIS